MKKSLLRNIFYSLMSNVISFAVSLSVAFIVPKYLGIKEYAYWQLYSFYVAYKGLLHFGWVDGIYLKYGGEKYDDLDKNTLHAQFVLLIFLEIFVTVGILFGSIFLIRDPNKQFVAICFGCACLVYLPGTFFQYILQATNRIAEYARCVFLERAFYAGVIVTFLFYGEKRYEILIIADLLAGCLTLLVMTYTCKDIICAKCNYLKGVHEAFSNIGIGSKLLIGNVGGGLIIGMARQLIEIRWGIETFGKISLTLSASNMLIILINAISLVIYPTIRRIEERKLKSLFYVLKDVMSAAICGMLIIYFPMKNILSIWLPQYSESLKYMALLFPMCLFEGIYYLLITTYLKALRKEKAIMIINWITVLFSALLLLLFSGNLTLTVITITIGLGIRCSMGIYYISKIFAKNDSKKILLNWCMASIFVICAWNGGIKGFLFYLVFYIVYLIFNIGRFKEFWSFVK